MAHVFIGDRVSTPDGEGIIAQIETWRQRVMQMRGPEAQEFSENCRMRAGENFQTDWYRAFVKIKGRGKWYECLAITMVDSRADK